MRNKFLSILAICALPLLVAGCANGNGNHGQQNVTSTAGKKAKPYTATCQDMHKKLERLYGSGKGHGKEYAGLLDTYMGRCL